MTTPVEASPKEARHTDSQVTDFLDRDFGAVGYGITGLEGADAAVGEQVVDVLNRGSQEDGAWSLGGLQRRGQGQYVLQGRHDGLPPVFSQKKNATAKLTGAGRGKEEEKHEVGHVVASQASMYGKQQ